MFETAVEDGIMESPGVDGLHGLLELNELHVALIDVQSVFDQKRWDYDRSFDKNDFVEFMEVLTSRIPGLSKEATSALSDKDNDLYERIAGRIDERSFPYVLAAEAQEETVKHIADSMLSSMMKSDYVEIQSYVDHKWAEFRSSSPVDDNVPEKVRRAKFMQDSFYVLCVQFYIERSFTEKRLRHHFSNGVFVPVIPVASMSDESKKAIATDATSSMSDNMVAQLDEKFWFRWAELTKYVSPTLELFGDYVRGEYFNIMADVVRCAPKVCIPKVSPTDSVGINVAECEDILRRMQYNDGNVVEAGVMELWTKHIETAPSEIRSFLPRSAPEEFWKEKYYVVARNVIGKHGDLPSFGGPSDETASSGSNTGHQLPQQRIIDAPVAGMNALMSGAAFSDVAVSNAIAESPLQYLGSAKILSEPCEGLRWMYEGIILECDDEPRVITARDPSRSPMKRKMSGSSSETVALDMVLADNTGPVNITLWDDAARTMASLLPNVGSQIVYLENLRIANVSKSEWNGAILTSLKVVHSVAAVSLHHRNGTEIRLTSTRSSPFLLPAATYSVPESPVAIRHFMHVRSKLTAPFKATLVGTIMNVGNPELSQGGHMKRTFEIVDAQGAWMKGLAIGKNATSVSLEGGVEVVLYGCNGRPGGPSLDAVVMVAKDSVIVPTGVRGDVVKRTFIEI